jgi:transcriptional regulator with XRE-family HTH domain
MDSTRQPAPTCPPADQRLVNPGDGGRWDPHRFAGQLGALGRRVRVTRRSHRLSQQVLAKHTGIGRSKISAIESGTNNLTLEVLWRLADGLGVHWADLLDDRATPRATQIAAPFDEQLRTFGIRAYQARVLQRLSQHALTRRTGIGRSAISEIEVGSHNVTLETLWRLADGLGVHWAELLDDRATHPPQPDEAHGADPPPGPAAQDEGEQTLGLQDLVDAFDRHDQPRLAGLSPEHLQRHLDARLLLADYLDQMWHDPQPHSLNPAQHPEWASVAALAYIAHHLEATARAELLRSDIRPDHRARRARGLVAASVEPHADVSQRTGSGHTTGTGHADVADGGTSVAAEARSRDEVDAALHDAGAAATLVEAPDRPPHRGTGAREPRPGSQHVATARTPGGHAVRLTVATLDVLRALVGCSESVPVRWLAERSGRPANTARTAVHRLGMLGWVKLAGRYPDRFELTAEGHKRAPALLADIRCR